MGMEGVSCHESGLEGGIGCNLEAGDMMDWIKGLNWEDWREGCGEATGGEGDDEQVRGL